MLAKLKLFFNNKKLRFLLKILFLALALYLIDQQIDLKDIYNGLKNLDVTVISILIGFNFIAIFFKAIRLSFFVKVYRADFRLIDSLNIMLRSSFLNSFLPSGMGGDAYKLYILKKSDINAKNTLKILIADRFNGLTSVALISCILFNFIKINSAFWNQLYLKTLISTVSFSIILAIYVWLSKKLFNENFRLTLKAWCCSLITQFSIAFAQIIIYYQIDQKIHILTYLWAVITTILTIILPITVGNFGLRESGMIFFSHYIDINPETAITGSIIMYLINLLVNISCSLTFLVAIKLKK